MAEPRPFRSCLGQVAKGLCSLIFPSHCGSCGCRIDEEKKGEESLLCPECLRQIVAAPAHCCSRCSHPMEGLVVCPNCAGRSWQLSSVVAGCHYGGEVRELIHRFKYGRDQRLALVLGALMARALEDPRLSSRKFDAVVPVPLHPLREREREFNQAALLANQIARRLEIPALNLLKRTRPTAPQAGFDRQERMENLRGAFALRRSVTADASLLLVDDVATTGMTSDACATVLLGAGAAEVCAVVVARG